MSKKEVAVKADTEVMQLDEEELELLSGGAGFEEIGQEDLVIPRLQIAQYNSPQIKKDNAKYIPDLEPGYIFNTVTGQVYGEEISFLAVKFTKSRTLFGQGGVIECSSVNGVDGGNQAERCVDEKGQPLCPHAQFGSGKNGKGTACTNFKNALGHVIPTLDLVSFSLKSSAVAIFREWNSKAQARKMTVMRGGKKTLLGDLPLYSTVYKISVVSKSHPDGDYFLPAINAQCWTKQLENGKDVLLMAKDKHEEFSAKQVTLTDGDFN